MPTQPNTDANPNANRRNALRLALLGFAVVAVILTGIALAGAPATPGGQAGGNAATATPAPTPTCAGPVNSDGSHYECFPAPPTMTDFQKQYQGKLSSSQRQNIQRYEAAMAAAASTDGTPAPTPTPQLEGVTISLFTADRVDDLRKLLEGSSAAEIECYYEPSVADGPYAPGCEAYAPVSKMRHIADLDWALNIEDFPPPPMPSSRSMSSSPQTWWDPHGVNGWRSAGIDGQQDNLSRIKVGIIDFGFKNLRSRLPNSAVIVAAHCWDDNGQLSKGVGDAVSNLNAMPGG